MKSVSRATIGRASRRRWLQRCRRNKGHLPEHSDIGPRTHRRGGTRFGTNAPFSYRSDSAIPEFPDDRPIIIFDVHCALCSRFARFVLRNDAGGVFRLAAAQSRLGQALFRHLNLDSADFETNVLLEDGLAHFKSDASIRIPAYRDRFLE